jgi:hypothetical protein
LLPFGPTGGVVLDLGPQPGPRQARFWVAGVEVRPWTRSARMRSSRARGRRSRRRGWRARRRSPVLG